MNPYNIKQVIFCGFGSRIFAGMIDAVIVSMILYSFLMVASPMLLYDIDTTQLGLQIHEYTRDNPDASNSEVWNFILENQEFKDKILSGKFITKMLLNYFIQIGIFALYFIYFWIKYSASPGKMIAGQRIADAKNLEKPSKSQFIIRFFSMILSAAPLMLGFIWIFFDSKKQAWHDKIAGTVVVKN